MKAMEQLLIEQRQKGNSLSSQLSAAQDRIGGAERRAQQLQIENEAIKTELKYWNDLYEQDGAVENVGENIDEVESSPKNTLPVAPEIPSSSGIAAPSADMGFTMPTFSSWSLPLTTSTVMDENVAMPPPMILDPFPSSNVGPEISPLLPTQQKDRRGSFGSTFAGSSGTGGNGGRGNGHVGVSGVTTSAMPTSAVFKMDIKPKEPPVFRGTAAEDVDTWLAKVEDFIYLTEANTRQQVAYMATLLQDAAGDWWTALLKERHGSRPADYTEMSALLRKRFGSSTRVDRARAALRTIKQSTNEGVRAYSTRFESLLSKLPSFDAEWAKSQYIWGLNQKVAELVVIAEPADLQAAILKAEKIEMARNTVSGNQGQTSGGWPRISRGRFSRGRGRFAAMQQAAGHGAQQTVAVQNQSGQPGPRLNLNNVQCYRCKGWGHMSSHCPSDRSVQYRGGRSGGRARGRSSERPRKRRTR